MPADRLCKDLPPTDPFWSLWAQNIDLVGYTPEPGPASPGAPTPNLVYCLGYKSRLGQHPAFAGPLPTGLEQSRRLKPYAASRTAYPPARVPAKGEKPALESWWAVPRCPRHSI